MASFFEYFPLWLNFYFQKLPWNWFPWFHEFFGMDFLAHRNVQISTVYLHFRNTMLDWSSITSRFTIGWWITSLNSHWAPSTYEFSYEWLIEQKSCSRGYYYGVIESIINYWQPRKQNKKNYRDRRYIRIKTKFMILLKLIFLMILCAPFLTITILNLYLLPILKFEKSLYWNINTKDFSEWIL